MKLILWDFDCSEHGLFEEMVKPGVRQAPCPRCGELASRQIPAPRVDLAKMALESSASPEAINHFDRLHRERKAIEERCYRDHGDYGTAAGCAGGRPVTPEIASSL